MGLTCERKTRECTFVKLPLQYSYQSHPYYYFIFMLCSLATFVASGITEFSEASIQTTQGCSQAERDALLAFKSSIQDSYNRLSSWNHQSDCCGWSRVVCSNDTTTASVHVVELNFGSLSLQSKTLSPSLLSLTHLEILDLSENDFGGAQIPNFIGSFQKLKYLDIQMSGFSGIIPPQLGNLSSLYHLGLESRGSSNLRVEDLDWLTRLSSLTYLDMSSVNLGAVSHNWLSTVNTLPFLQELRLSDCRLDQVPYSPSQLNLTSLVSLSLGDNNFNSTLPFWLWQLNTLLYLYLSNSFHGTIPAAIGNLRGLKVLYLFESSLSGSIPVEIGYLTSLQTLNLEGNSLSGPIPVEIGYLTTLQLLVLSRNSLSGPIPREIGNLTSLTVLFLDRNSLTGLIPIEIGKLFNLNTLYLSYNSLEGVVSQLYFTNLTSLQSLDLSNNFLLTIDHKWAIPFQFQFLSLNSLMLGPTFPIWLKSLNFSIGLGLSNTGIEGNFPSWFWTSFSTFNAIDLSYNKITGSLPLSLERFTNLTFLNLRSNILEGTIPKFPFTMDIVDLSINSFLGPLPLDFSSSIYILSYNQIHGKIPLSICDSTRLEFLDLSHNQISGEIPRCEWKEPRYLKVIHLGNNNLNGKIPRSIGQLSNLESLHLNDNNICGQVPSSLQNCNELRLLDIGNNKISGTIPTWIGQRLQKLSVLRLRSNKFSGDIPLHIGQLSNLQIIDLANNFLTGSIPVSLGNLSAIISTSMTMFGTTYILSAGALYSTQSENITAIMKGYEYSFSNTLSLVKSIDFSNNYLVGEIPKELGYLEGLQSLNLSRNYLKGNIPSTIGGMKSLETLDLSYNALSGVIPQDLSALNYLNNLNLSYNNLSGMIPQGNQLQTLQDASIYKGNVYLCGASINKSCLHGKNITATDEGHQDSLKMLRDYLGITLGFLLGLWSVFVILLLKKSWKDLYFLMIDNIYDKAYVAIMIQRNKWMIRQ